MLKPVRTACLALAAACLAVTGCGSGEKLVAVKGRVVEKGAPVNVSNYQDGVNCVRVIFVPLDDAGATTNKASQTANAKEDGSFEMTGNMGDGISPGKYRVAVQKMSDGPNGPAEVDAWKGRFDVKSSPFVFDVQEGMANVTIDLSAPPQT